MKLFKVSSIFLIFIVIIGCNNNPKVVIEPNNYQYNNYTIDYSKAFDQLDSLEKQQFLNNFAIAKHLAEYDYYSWVASDTISNYLDQGKLKPEQIQEWISLTGWFALIDSTHTKVVFGYSKDTNFIGVAEVFFKDKKPTKTSLRQKTYRRGMVLENDIELMQKVKDVFHREIYETKVPYNIYFYGTFNNRYIYLIPAKYENNLSFGGGIKVKAAKFYPNHHQTYGGKAFRLHSDVNIIKDYQNTDFVFRASNKNEIVNEVDIAQFLIYRYFAPIQYIKTPKYTFMMKWLPHKNHIIVDLVKNGEDNLKKLERFKK